MNKKVKITKDQKKYTNFKDIKEISFYRWKISIPHSNESIIYLTSTKNILGKLLEKYDTNILKKLNLDTYRKIFNFIIKNNLEWYNSILDYESNYSYSWKTYYWSNPISWYPLVLYTPSMKVIKKYIKSKIEKVSKNIKRTPNTKKVFDASKIAQDKEKVIESLYVLNKYTKKLRDEKACQIEKIYWDDWCNYYYPRFILNKMHDKLHNLKYEIEKMYEIKSKTIEKLSQKWILQLEWYHTFDDWYSRDYYTFWIFKFHDNTNNSNINLWHISWIISQEKELSKMSYKRALEILWEFLKDHELEQISI